MDEEENNQHQQMDEDEDNYKEHENEEQNQHLQQQEQQQNQHKNQSDKGLFHNTFILNSIQYVYYACKQVNCCHI